MIKKIIAGLLALVAAAAFAAVDANKATQAELEAIKGVGPAIATKIIDERKKGAFKDWNDMVERVKGVGEGNAAKFSTEGLTVNGAGFKGAAPAATKPAAKADDKKAAPAAAAAPAPAAAPAVAKVDDKKAAAMKAADDKKAAADAKKKEKEDKKAAKAAAAAEKASAPKK
jgi:competence protein ComEA